MTPPADGGMPMVFSLQDTTSRKGLLRQLRPHQQQALDEIKTAVATGYRRPILQAPCSFGKTVVAAHIVAGARAKGKRVTFCVPFISLVDQTVERFIENGINPSEIGVIQADHEWRRDDAPVQVASAQTLVRRGYPETDVVVIDEVHLRYAIYDQWMSDERHAGTPFIGLSATPWSRGLGKLFNKLIRPILLRELIDLRHSAPFRVFAPTHPDLKGVKTVAGDYHEGQLAERMSQPTLVADIVGTWLERSGGKPSLCYAVNRAHAKLIHDQFEKCGVPVAYVDANTPMEERNEIGRRIACGETKVAVNIGTLTTGIDWPLWVMSLARPTKSEMLLCIDSETEVLTSHGWKGIGDVSPGDCAATLDTETGRGRWARVLGVVDRDMDEEESWIEYRAPRANFRVTNKHNMLFRSSKEASYKLDHAEKMLSIKGTIYMPTAVSMQQHGVPLTDAELYFIGMMMTDGHWGRVSGSITQSERHPEIVDRIEDCIRGCGIGYAKRRIAFPSCAGAAAVIQERHPRWHFSMSVGKPKAHANLGKRVADNAPKREWDRFEGERGFGHLLPYMDKDISPALMAISKEQFVKLVEGIFDGDGFKLKAKSVDWTPRSWTICSARRLFVERLQALAAINGMTANVREEVSGRTNPIWVITITPKDWRTVGGYASNGNNGGSLRGPRPQVERRPPTNERVWCIQTETGTIVTRRRGKVTVMGNCQMVGRFLRTDKDDPDKVATILDHSDSHLRMGFVTEIDERNDELDTGRKDKAAKSKKDEEKTLPLPRECPICACLVPASEKECPECGHVHKRPVSVLMEDGDLGELLPGGKRKKEKREPVLAQLRRMSPEELYGQLKGYASERGKSDKWCTANYKDIMDRWPSNETKEVHRIFCGDLLRGWLRRKMIAWAKAHEKRGGEHVYRSW